MERGLSRVASDGEECSGARRGRKPTARDSLAVASKEYSEKFVVVVVVEVGVVERVGGVCCCMSELCEDVDDILVIDVMSRDKARLRGEFSAWG